MVLFNLFVFLLVVFVSFWCLCLWFSFIILFYFLIVVFFFFFLLSFLFWGLSVVFFFFFFLSSSCLFSLSCVFLLFVSYVNHIIYIPLSFSLFTCMSFDCSCCCVFSLFLLFPIFCLFFFPGPRARTWKGKQWKEQVPHFVCLWGIFAKMSFQETLFLFVLWISFVHKTCFCLMDLEYIWRE